LLSGIRVLDCSRLIIGDLATSRLADLGADVVKVRDPTLADTLSSLPPLIAGVSLRYLLYNTNKRYLDLDPDDRSSLHDELDRCDAVVVLGTPGSLDRVGLSYDALCGSRPGLVYCAITPYGSSGPYRDLPAHGNNIDAAAGYGELAADGFAVGGMFAANYAATAILAGIWRRSRSGQGARIEVSCWAAAVEANVAFWSHLNGLEVGREHPLAPERMASPGYGVFFCGDGKPVFLAVVTREEWRRFCRAAGVDEVAIADAPESPGGWLVSGRDPVGVSGVLGRASRDEWMARFVAHRVPASPLLSPAELAAERDELIGSVRSAVEVGGERVWLPGAPVVIDGEPLPTRHFEPLNSCTMP
jgi:crotonobetainyl-CoA:carnitine CoA-transferase CaiB-like acyl-CoA transferase